MKTRLTICFFLLSLTCKGQLGRLAENIEYKTELTGSFSKGEVAPLWFSSNRYGLGTPNPNSGYFRAGLMRDIHHDYSRKWRVGYGADIAVPMGMDKCFVLQQLYVDAQWKNLRLSIGQKERQLELKNDFLSSGGLGTGINARPLPQVRLEVPDFLNIPGTRNWLAIKGYIAYGAYTDNGWQKKHNNNSGYKYTANSLYHTKAGFLRIGNTEKFPVSLTGGLEMSCQFGGHAWNLMEGNRVYDEDLPSGLKSFLNAFIPGGSDSNDGLNPNKEGNQLGSWHLSVDYQGKGWKARGYAEHFFEDHSQMFLQYPWKDMLWGIEVELPKNRWVSTILYEHLKTTHQSGPVYHDATSVLPEQISAVDQYYNNHIYGAWQHAGFTMGTPLLISPIYNKDGSINVYHNRVKMHHIGICGEPTNHLAWRFLYTHHYSLGTYQHPLLDPLKSNYLLGEITYHIPCIKGLSCTIAYGHNSKGIIPRSNGAMLTVKYQGWINKKNN